MDQTLGTSEKLKLLLHDIPNDAQVFPPSTWPEEEKEINRLTNEVQKLGTQLTLFEKLERHFDNPKGPDLMEILTALRDQGKIWLEVPEVNPDISPPLSITEWLWKVVTDDLGKLVEGLESWQSGIWQKRYKLQQNVFEKQKEMQNKTELLKKSKEIFHLLEQTGLSAKLDDIINCNSPIPSSAIKERIFTFITQPNRLLSAVEHVQEAISQWIQVEELDELRISALQQEKSYLRVKKYIDTVSEALQKEAGKNSVLSIALLPPRDVLRKLEKNVNEILERFRIVEGICPVRFDIKRNKKGKTSDVLLQIYSADGRPLNAFSTGQKAQLGFALLLGLNYSLNRYIGHNIIAMDDVTAVFDMAQLPRTAALIRQIAYAPEEKSARRQVFIVSHHEDLTNRLLDFLIPPEGRELRILKFVNWSQADGPKIEQRRAISGMEVSAVSRKKFADMLNAICKKSY